MQNNHPNGMDPSQLQNLRRMSQMRGQQQSFQGGQNLPSSAFTQNAMNPNMMDQNPLSLSSNPMLPSGMVRGTSMGNWNNALSNSQSPMDASNTSSARLMASIQMNMGGSPPLPQQNPVMGQSSNMTGQFSNTMQAFMQARAQQQRQNMGQGGAPMNPAMGGSGAATQNAMLQQLNSGMRGGMGGNGIGMSGNMGMMSSSSGGHNNAQFQQQLLQRQQSAGMQMPYGDSTASASNLMNMMQQQMPMSSQRGSFVGSANQPYPNPMMQQQHSNQHVQRNEMNPAMNSMSSRGQNLGQSMNASMPGGMGNMAQNMGASSRGQMGGGPLDEHNLRAHQQNIMRNSQMDQSQASQRTVPQSSYQSTPMNPMGTSNRAIMGQSQTNVMSGMSVRERDTGMNNMSQRELNRPNIQMDSSQRPSFPPQRSRGVLEGTLVGGWQSNADLQDRRNVIFHILEIIRRMRPNNDDMSDKLPHMAKSLEEHLYRSARSKEEYLEYSTLKSRLQAIAQGLDVHRIPSSSSVQGNSPLGFDDTPPPSSMANPMFPNGDGNNPNGQWGFSQTGSSDQVGPLSSNNSAWSGVNVNIHGQMAVSGAAAVHPDGNMDSSDHSDQPPTVDPDYPNIPKFDDATAAKNKRTIQQQQQRLLLLRHASKCKGGSECTTKFCQQMKELWKHLKECRSRNCETPHCVSSRCVLNHYRICSREGRTGTCEVCGPVMSRIREMESSSSSLKQGQLFRDSELGDSLRSNSGSFLPFGGAAQDQERQLEEVQMQQAKLETQMEMLRNLQHQQATLETQQAQLQQQLQNASSVDSPQAQQLHQQQVLLKSLQQRCEQQQLSVQNQIQSYQQHESTNNITEIMQKPNHGSLQGKTGGAVTRRPSLGKTLQQVEDALETSENSRVSVNIATPGHNDETTAVYGTKIEPFVDQGTSLIPYLNKESIHRHLHSLNKKIRLSSRTVTHKCMPLIDGLVTHPYGWVFTEPVDPIALNLPDYFEVVKNPMHLALVKKKLENAIYPDMEAFARDVRLVFENAILYNGQGSEVGGIAQGVLSEFNANYSAVVKDIESSHLHLESQGAICSLCGDQKRMFEPTVLYCQGTCGMQRIKRDATYYTDSSKSNYWCQDCFALLDEEKKVELEDGTEINKRNLIERKNDSQPEEGWVNCDDCHSWVHQICALYNGRHDQANAKFSCPNCLLRNMPTDDPLVSDNRLLKGADCLPRSLLSDSIETGLAKSLNAAYLQRAKELKVSIEDVEKCAPLTVRVISSVRKTHDVGTKMKEFYDHMGYPSHFPVTTKCIGLFQKLHGIDTFLFALYVYEYGHEAPSPNRRRVYISYLDSVQFFEPKCYRTTAYQTILVEYLRHAKDRGFHTAHIWSCPPTPGDDYIFHCHPSQQKFPREDMLRSWYHSMLDKAKNEGVVIRTSTMFDEYFSDNDVDKVPSQTKHATCLPYFEGDYIPGEIESILSKMTPDEQAVGNFDGVMSKLAVNMKKMKDSFIVVHLRNRRFAAAVERGEDVSKWTEDSDEELIRGKRAKIGSKDSGAIPGFISGSDLHSKGENSVHVAEEQTATSAVPQSTDPDCTSDNPDNIDIVVGENSEEKVNPDENTESEDKTDPIENTESEDKTDHIENTEKSEEKSDVTGSKEGTGDGKSLAADSRDEMKNLLEENVQKLKRGPSDFIADTSDSDPVVENDLFENRQQFLNYCRTNHCQFDDLRRSKHSTMIVLYRLHNPLSVHQVAVDDRTRGRNSRVRKQQKIMDDRRRRAQNELYHTSGETEIVNVQKLSN